MYNSEPCPVSFVEETEGPQPPNEPRPRLESVSRRRQSKCRLTCTRQVPVQRRPTMDPSAFGSIFLGFRPWTRRESYSSRSDRWLVVVTAGGCGHCWLTSIGPGHVFVVPWLRNSTGVIWNGGRTGALEGAVYASISHSANEEKCTFKFNQTNVVIQISNRSIRVCVCYVSEVMLFTYNYLFLSSVWTIATCSHIK